MEGDNISQFEDQPIISDRVFEYTDAIQSGSVAVVIDNGSYKCRAGWSHEESPCLVFKNIIAKPRAKKALDGEILVGNDIGNIDMARWQIKSPFERNIVTQFDAQEQVLDYIFSHLGINTEGSVDHPVVMTEPVCNPGYCREKMSELLFECYCVPRLAYGIDALFSYCHNARPTSDYDALIVSCGYQATHVLPVLNGRLRAPAAQRINIGGAAVDGFMQRVLQLKYPQHLSAISLSRAEELVQRLCHMAVDFESELLKWTNDEYYSSHVQKIQLPFNQKVKATYHGLMTHVIRGLTTKDGDQHWNPTFVHDYETVCLLFDNVQQAASNLSAEQLKDRREQQVRRLRQLSIKRYQRKLVVEQEQLQKLMTAHDVIQDIDDDIDDEIVMRALREVGLRSVEELKESITRLSCSIQQLQDKISRDDDDSTKLVIDPSAVGEDLMRQDDSTQRRQRATKKTKMDKKLESDKMLADSDKDSLEVWISSLHRQRQEILNAQAERRQRRQEMTKRRTHASQHRMKILTELAHSSKRKKEDTFGMNDDDWDVYKQINTEGGDTDSEDEADRLEEVESYLRVYDPEFRTPNQPEVVFDIAEYHRLHIALEQIRTPELLYQPSMLGEEQAGIAETIQYTLGKFSVEEQQRLCQNIFVTGGCASFPNFVERLSREIQAVRPFDSKFAVTVAGDVVLGAWHGASRWAMSPALTDASVTVAEYNEKGGEYLKEHCASNNYVPTAEIYGVKQ